MSVLVAFYCCPHVQHAHGQEPSNILLNRCGKYRNRKINLSRNPVIVSACTNTYTVRPVWRSTGCNRQTPIISFTLICSRLSTRPIPNSVFVVVYSPFVSEYSLLFIFLAYPNITRLHHDGEILMR